jgi:hypothetical protein
MRAAVVTPQGVGTEPRVAASAGLGMVLTENVTIPSPAPFFSFAARAAVDDAGDKIVYQSTNGCFLVLTAASAHRASHDTGLVVEPSLHNANAITFRRWRHGPVHLLG